MQRRHPLPKLWLMTDERQGDALWPAIKALPRNSGIIVRHYSWSDKDRIALTARIRSIARRRGHTVIFAGSRKLALRAKADGYHQRSLRHAADHFVRTVAVHNLREMQVAERVRADLIFVSPIFATQSHPGARPLGRVRFGKMVQQAAIPVIALGGMNARRVKTLSCFGIYGWAGIGALTPKQQN